MVTNAALIPGIDAGLRFLNGRTEWVKPERPLFNARHHEVARVPERTARALIERHHYSHSFPSALRCYGLYRGPFCVGAVAITWPMNDATIKNWYPDLELGDEAAEIGRVVLLPGAAFNAASWMLSRAFELERQRGTLGLLAFSDPMPRTTLSGDVVLPGHTGITYQALGAAYAGRSRKRKLKLLPDATALPERALEKIVGRERGWGGVAKRLLAAGVPVTTSEDHEARRQWARSVGRYLRPLDHGGNHRFLFPLEPLVGLMVPPGPYPRARDAA